MFNDVIYNQQVYSQQEMEAYYENMQNMYTPGARAVNTQFVDVYSEYVPVGGTAPRHAVTEVDFSQGKLTKTKSPTDLAIEGNGFFVVTDGTNDAYTRNGKFSVKDGVLTAQNGLKVKGYKLDENGQLAGDPVAIEMGLDPETKLYSGRYTGYKFDEAGILYGTETMVDPVTKNAVTTEVPIYQVAIASFANASGLKPAGATTFVPTTNSGPAIVGYAGEGALGSVKPSHLEMSNVDYIQQTYHASRIKQQQSTGMKILQVQDELIKSATNMIR
ncbi:MAG: flagellar hook basal-body protein [Armatimonadota bacterium]